MKILYIDFSHLRNLPESFVEKLSSRTMEVIKSKYEGTSVFITDSKEAAEIAGMDSPVNVIRIHNMPELDNNNPALGNAVPDIDAGEVNLQDFIEQGFGTSSEILGDQIGTVAAHEGFHLLGPGEHSLMNNNLMSEGEVTAESLRETGGKNLEFTELQKAILNGNLDETANLKLHEIESVYDEWLESVTDVEDIEDLFVDILDSLI